MTSLVLQPTLLLIQARLPLAFFATLLAHIQLLSTSTQESLHAEQLSSHPCPRLELQGVAETQVQDVAFGFIEPPAVVLSLLIESVQVSLKSLPALEQINTPNQSGVICKLSEGCFISFSPASFQSSLAGGHQ